MELDGYLRAIFRMWYVPLALLALAIGGSWFYLNVTNEAEATATVAVLEPRAPVPGEFIPPRLLFDVIDESEELPNRVASRLDDGTMADELSGSFSIELRPTINSSPVYLVSASAETEARAIELANIAVEEARILFGEFNTPSLKDVRAAFQPELDSAEAAQAQARAALSLFVADNDAYNLPLRTDQQILLISQLRVADRQSALTIEEAELQRLMSLEPEYTKLELELTQAEDLRFTIEQQILAVVVAQTLPSESQVRLLESAVVVSGLWWTMITYTLAVMLAIFLSLTLIYVLAFFARTFPTTEELEHQLGAPIIVRIPEATTRRRKWLA